MKFYRVGMPDERTRTFRFLKILVLLHFLFCFASKNRFLFLKKRNGEKIFFPVFSKHQKKVNRRECVRLIGV